MKVNKTQAVLYMYELLLLKGSFSKQEIISAIEMTNLTFLRYIQELRAYLYNFGHFEELFYSKNKDLYYLNKEKEN